MILLTRTLRLKILKYHAGYQVSQHVNNLHEGIDTKNETGKDEVNTSRINPPFA